MLLLAGFLSAISFFSNAHSADLRDDAIARVSELEPQLVALHKRIWEFSEVGLKETRSSAALQEFLTAQGFHVEHGVAGMPTAFVASWGSGKPVIGILAEYDALPGVSQQAVPERKPREGVDAGHACGHSVFGAASAGAACAAKSVLQQQKLPGTIRLYGTPAEETAIGKQYMLRAGLFEDVDVVLSWHVRDLTFADYAYTKAVVSAKFRFHGIAAHASRDPEQGRSALDAVELMNVGANYLREHVKEDARIHYVITNGGGQPNVVPPEAEVWYYVRANRHDDVERYFARLRKIAEGAASMTETTFDVRIESDAHEVLPNRALALLLDKNLRHVGPPRFDAAETAFARGLQQPLEREQAAPLSLTIDPVPEIPDQITSSTDIGDVSWSVPVGSISVCAAALGTAAHSWQWAASTGTTIGEKGLSVAAKTLAASAIELFTTPSQLDAARKDFHAVRDPLRFVTLVPEGQQAPAAIR
ncbi:MAG TPA: amidohydrolase [Planctomycetota bacterium]|nr:amidohydrolase [Planctomycetota bacterium]